MCSVSPLLEHRLIISHKVTTTKESYRLTLEWKDLNTLYLPSSPQAAAKTTPQVLARREPQQRPTQGSSSAKRTHGQFPANRYPAAWASASVAKRTRCCGETFAALGQ